MRVCVWRVVRVSGRVVLLDRAEVVGAVMTTHSVEASAERRYPDTPARTRHGHDRSPHVQRWIIPLNAVQRRVVVKPAYTHTPTRDRRLSVPTHAHTRDSRTRPHGLGG